MFVSECEDVFGYVRDNAYRFRNPERSDVHIPDSNTSYLTEI